MRKHIPHLLAGALVVGLFGTTGCVARAGYATPAPGAAVTVTTDAPSLAYVAPNVWVMQGYADPVFYVDNGYWMYRGGYWYRSYSYRGGWVRAGYVPYGIRTYVRNPYRYRHYRARRGVRVRRAFRVNRRVYRNRYRNRVHRRAVRRHNRRVIRHNRRVRRHNRRVIRRERRKVRRERRRDRRHKVRKRHKRD